MHEWIGRWRHLIDHALYGSTSFVSRNRDKHPWHNAMRPELPALVKIQIGFNLAPNCRQMLSIFVYLDRPAVFNFTRGQHQVSVRFEPPTEAVGHPSVGFGPGVQQLSRTVAG